MEKPHVFLTGDVQVGKSFLLKKVLKELDVPLSGFTTKWGETTEDGADLYLRDMEGEVEVIAAHRAPQCNLTIFLDAFEREGVFTLQDLKGLVIMDELGRFEAKTEKFSRRVFEILDSDMPVFGVVRDMDVDFLNAVREHPKTQVIRVTLENRDSLFFEVLKIVGEIMLQASAKQEGT